MWLRSAPQGAEGRGSKPACAGLDCPKKQRLWRYCGLQGMPAARQSRFRGILVFWAPVPARLSRFRYGLPMESALGASAAWRGMAPAQLQREYSPSSCIGGNYQPFIEAYRSRSNEARARCEALGASWPQRRYGLDAAQTLELCLPAGAAAASSKPGLLVFIHGGYWQELSAQDSLFAASACIECGLAFAALDYTLAPKATVQQIVAECRMATAWLFAHADELGFDVKRVVVAGSSAGAHLAAMVVQRSWSDAATPHAERVRAAVLVSGIYDLEPLVGTDINQALGLDAAAARQASPALQGLAGFPPSIVCWGEIETAEFKRQSRDFASALQAAGSVCEIFEVPKRNHFDAILDLTDASTRLGRATLALLQDAALDPVHPETSAHASAP